MMGGRYEKYEIFLAGPHEEGANKLSITHDCVKNTGPSIIWKKKKQMKKNDMFRSTWIELRISFFS